MKPSGPKKDEILVQDVSPLTLLLSAATVLTTATAGVIVAMLAGLADWAVGWAVGTWVACAIEVRWLVTTSRALWDEIAPIIAAHGWRALFDITARLEVRSPPFTPVEAIPMAVGVAAAIAVAVFFAGWIGAATAVASFAITAVINTLPVIARR